MLRASVVVCFYMQRSISTTLYRGDHCPLLWRPRSLAFSILRRDEESQQRRWASCSSSTWVAVAYSPASTATPISPTGSSWSARGSRVDPDELIFLTKSSTSSIGERTKYLYLQELHNIGDTMLICLRSSLCQASAILIYLCQIIDFQRLYRIFMSFMY